MVGYIPLSSNEVDSLKRSTLAQYRIDRILAVRQQSKRCEVENVRMFQANSKLESETSRARATLDSLKITLSCLDALADTRRQKNLIAQQIANSKPRVEYRRPVESSQRSQKALQKLSDTKRKDNEKMVDKMVKLERVRSMAETIRLRTSRITDRIEQEATQIIAPSKPFAVSTLLDRKRFVLASLKLRKSH